MAEGVHVIVRHGGEDGGEEPAKPATEVEEETSGRENQNICVKRLRSHWLLVLFGVAMVVLYSVTFVFFVQMHTYRMAKKNNQLTQLAQNSMRLEAENQKLHSILFSDKLSFLWRFCDLDTLQCSRCLTGWVEHASRCFSLSRKQEKWERARSECLEMGADLAVVLNAEDQEFLTNMTYDFTQQHPEEYFHSAWIGLRDVIQEGTYVWVNGRSLQKDVVYWMPLEPNNAMAAWDVDQEGQDCVAIVPPSPGGQEDWLKTWDDIVCVGKRHYLCETAALSLF